MRKKILIQYNISKLFKYKDDCWAIHVLGFIGQYNKVKINNKVYISKSWVTIHCLRIFDYLSTLWNRKRL